MATTKGVLSEIYDYENLCGMQTADQRLIADVQLMLFGLGDCSSPLEDTAVIALRVLRLQLRSLVERILDAMEMRSAKTTNLDDFVFALRRDTLMLQRIRDSLEMQKYKSSCDDDQDGTQQSASTAASKLKQYVQSLERFGIQLKKSNYVRRKNSDVIDDDDERETRLKRLDRLTKNMDTEKYIKFSEARQTSFRSSKRLKMLLGSETLARLSPQLHLIVALVAHETLARLVDFALLLRNKENNSVDVIDEPLPLRPDEIGEAVRRLKLNETMIRSGKKGKLLV